MASSRDQKFQTNKEGLIGTDTLWVSGWCCRLGLVKEAVPGGSARRQCQAPGQPPPVPTAGTPVLHRDTPTAAITQSQRCHCTEHLPEGGREAWSVPLSSSTRGAKSPKVKEAAAHAWSWCLTGDGCPEGSSSSSTQLPCGLSGSSSPGHTAPGTHRGSTGASGPSWQRAALAGTEAVCPCQDGCPGKLRVLEHSHGVGVTAVTRGCEWAISQALHCSPQSSLKLPTKRYSRFFPARGALLKLGGAGGAG